VASLELPWPPTSTSPNASRPGNWWVKSKGAAKYRGECLTLLKFQSVPKLYVDGPVMLEMVFCPPTKRLSDLDNLLSRTKQGIDALAELMGVDDQIFEYTLRRGDPVKHGRVLVHVGAGA
jgi:crossover junction endodeoxyribonuclease RusA